MECLDYLLQETNNLLLRRQVAGTCRSSDKQIELQQQGYQAFIFDTDQLSLGLGYAPILGVPLPTFLDSSQALIT